MQVDWNWIKQRPHFIAEKLAEQGHEVCLYHRKYYNKKLLSNNAKGNFPIKPIPAIPFSRFKPINNLNKFIYKLFIKIILKFRKFDYIYITHPTLMISQNKVPYIYDCMDDLLEFSKDKKYNDYLSKLEKNLIDRADFVFFTSEHLRNTVLKRYNIELNESKYNINNNAVELPKTQILEYFDLGSNDKTKLVYIGSVSEWFDFTLLQQLDENKFEIHLFGPVYNSTEKYPQNFIFHGPVAREKIFSIMNSADVLVMPFIVNELIKSVNPVKLYEYIFSGKPIISVRYPETEKFSNYVYLYNNQDFNSFMDCIRDIEKNNFCGKKALNDCIEYVNSNTWSNRVETICKIVSSSK